MALTTRTNGSSPANLVQASWWNDFLNLLTGAMSDQPVKIANSLTLVAPAAPAALSAALHSGSGLSVGAYKYCYTYVNAEGAESPASATTSITTTSGNQQVTLSSIATGPAGTTKRIIYRTQVGGTQFTSCATISDNTTTSFTDTSSDATIASFIVLYDALQNGGILFKDNGGTLQGFIGQSDNNSGTVEIHAAGRVEFTVTAEGEPSKQVYIDSNGLNLMPGLNASQSLMRVGNSLGIKNNANAKLLEIKNGGNLIIAGTQYQTSAGSISTAASQSFDSFDMAETFEVDREYPPGTILCPADTATEIPFTLEEGAHRNQPKLSQCSHDGCALALISVANPGFLAGLINLPSQEDYDESQPMTMACSMTGRVFSRTAYHIPGRSYVCSDGRGGVRPVQSGESVMALGVTLGPTTAAKVPLLIRPTFVRLP